MQKSLVNGIVTETRPKNDDCPKVRGRFEPILSEELYNMAQNIRKNKPTVHTGTPNALQNPLTGLVYCEKCHTLMTRQVNYAKFTYSFLRCPNSKCPTVSAPLYLIERKIIDGLWDWVKQYELEWPQELSEDSSKMIEILDNNLKNLTDKYEQTMQQISKTYDLLEQGVYTLTVFQERHKILEEKKASYEAEISHLQNQIKDAQAREEAKRNFIPQTKKILDTYWKTDDVEIRNSMLKEILDHIDYSKTERNKKGQRDLANFTLHFYPKLPESH